MRRPSSLTRAGAPGGVWALAAIRARACRSRGRGRVRRCGRCVDKRWRAAGCGRLRGACGGIGQRVWTMAAEARGAPAARARRGVPRHAARACGACCARCSAVPPAPRPTAACRCCAPLPPRQPRRTPRKVPPARATGAASASDAAARCSTRRASGAPPLPLPPLRQSGRAHLGWGCAGVLQGRASVQ
jgi:hypothetical protein